jgi:hypothetical protein
MHFWRNASPVLVLAVAAGVVLIPGTASAQEPFVLQESGFDVTDLGSSAGPKGAACSPGGVWGDYVYIGESSGNAVERIDFLDNVSLFASGSPDIDFPVGMAFGPGPANDFGTFLYVANYGSGRITRLDTFGGPTLFVNYPQVTDLAFDPTGAYGTDLFAATYFGDINTVSSTGVITLFSSAVQSLYLRFGPGGVWGTGLYATNNSGPPGVGIVTVATDGTPTLFSGGFTNPEQFDWAFGGSFGGDMFASDMAAGEVWRVKPDGTRTLFATGERPAGIVFCNDCLYVTSFAGGCWKICESPTTVESATWGGIKQTYGAEEPETGEDEE